VQRRAFSLHFGPENDRTGAADAAGTNGKLMGGGCLVVVIRRQMAMAFSLST
jgi:hypothetical protein